ncbi:hypothetical protein AN641_06735 [Candidatus Epulonipiscioides gigas]|nr:hypothetical protein AN641_06735 [Epulopiscium sp. SCG-C07WGA-EpuloA2]
MVDTIYLKVFQKSEIITTSKVQIKDVSKITATTIELKNKINELIVLEIKEQKKAKYLITIIDIIKVIQRECPNVVIVPLGEVDTLVEYSPTPLKHSKLFEFFKVILVCFIVFAGSSVAIIAYQVDTAFAKTLDLISKVFTGEAGSNPLWITIPYAIGMPIGIIVFFNHVGTQKITSDPTPIEIEINKYRAEVNTTIIDSLNNIKRKEE